jgi:beta-N-acetylhexosaminidase
VTSTASISATLALSVTVPLTSTTAITTALQQPVSWVPVPLLIGLDWAGDDSSIFSGSGGFTPIPSEMAIGATWSPQLAERVGQVVGQELQAVGVNLLLGPTLDVLDVPRPGNQGDLATRTFGGDPFWVGQLARAFIRGVQGATGGAGQPGSRSLGGVVTAAKHFPGQGGSDRRPEDEVATVQKSMQELRQIELAPFTAVASGSDLRAPGTTAALMTSHIRYRGFQGNIRQLTPPISLAPQLQDLMGLKEFADWRAAGGVLISDALGVPALRRYYDPALQKFPHRQVAQDAFLAGNDLLYLSRFALTDDWPQQFQAMKETILFSAATATWRRWLGSATR